MATVNEHQETEATGDAAALEVDVSWLFAEPPAAASVEADPNSSTRCYNADSDEDLFRALTYMMEDKGSKLMQAAEKGAVEEVRTELAAGADVEERDSFYFGTVLHCAARNGHAEVVRCLLEHGAKVDAAANWGMTALHAAVMNWGSVGEHGRAAAVRVLLAAGADPNARGMLGRTPLHWAAEHGDAEVAAALLDAGANRAARNGDWDTPLHVAKQKKHQQLVEMLKTWKS